MICCYLRDVDLVCLQRHFKDSKKHVLEKINEPGHSCRENQKLPSGSQSHKLNYLMRTGGQHPHSGIDSTALELKSCLKLCWSTSISLFAAILLHTTPDRLSKQTLDWMTTARRLEPHVVFHFPNNVSFTAMQVFILVWVWCYPNAEMLFTDVMTF